MEKSEKSMASRTKILKRMLKISTVIILGFLLFTIIYTLNSRGIKSYYCLSNGKCVTVWKRTNGEVYIIPGKYGSNNKPTVSHIRTINKQFVTLYFSNEIELSYKIIVRDEGNLESSQKGYTIENDIKGEWEILEFSDSYKSILYEPNAIKFKDVKESTNYLTINIQENYATDKSGNKLK